MINRFYESLSLLLGANGKLREAEKFVIAREFYLICLNDGLGMQVSLFFDVRFLQTLHIQITLISYRNEQFGPSVVDCTLFVQKPHVDSNFGHPLHYI